MNYAIVGTGAIGGFYGARLAKAGREVHFLLHSDYEHVARHGLQVDSCDGSFHIDNVNAYSSAAQMPKVDVVIVALKTTANAMLAEVLPPIVHERTLVLLIQNGIGIEADVQRMFPGMYLAAGLAFICAAKTGPGRVEHLCNGNINIGNYSCPDQSLVDLMMHDFSLAGIKTGMVDYLEARWKKALWNIPFNGMCVAMDCMTDQLLDHPAGMQLVKGLMAEVIEAARAMGVENIGGHNAEKMIRFTRDMPSYAPSMKLDYDCRRPMEIYYLYTRPLEELRSRGLSAPNIEMLERQLRFLEDRNMAATHRNATLHKNP